MVENITQTQGLVGGALIGIGASLMLIFNGRSAGISGIYNGILQFYRGNVAWRIYFLLGLLAGGFAIIQFRPEGDEIANPIRSLSWIAVGGILVGFGAVMSTGCTTGHGLCGLSRFNRRSLVAVLVFMASGMITATLVHQIMNASGGLQ